VREIPGDDRDDDRVVPIDPDLAPSDPGEPARGRLRARRPASRVEWDVLAAIAAGGALGAPARYGVAQIVHVAPDTFPWATFWTNVSGSFALGFLLILLIERYPPTRYVRPFFATGFLGAFTTFSTFAVETDLLIKDGHAALGVVYALASLAAGFAAVWVGMLGARLAPGREGRGA
jgi:CrcB protein